MSSVGFKIFIHFAVAAQLCSFTCEQAVIPTSLAEDMTIVSPYTVKSLSFKNSIGGSPTVGPGCDPGDLGLGSTSAPCGAHFSLCLSLCFSFSVSLMKG